MWAGVGYNLVLFGAALALVPQSYLDAAQIDGANTWQRFWMIRLPIDLASHFFASVMTVIAPGVRRHMRDHARRPGDATMTLGFSILIRLRALPHGLRDCPVLGDVHDHHGLRGAAVLSAEEVGDLRCVTTNRSGRTLSRSETSRPSRRSRCSLCSRSSWMVARCANDEVLAHAPPAAQRGTLGELHRGMGASAVRPFFVSSLVVAISVTIIVVVVCAWRATAFARLNFWGHDQLFLAYLGTLP